MPESFERRPVAVLPPSVANRIAAGEVIERPASVVRELLDNSLDAGAKSIEIAHEGGGLELIRVHDDGVGMEHADVELCWKPHATSKIRTIEDLDRALSLGFRGEALASMAAVAELTVTSTPRTQPRADHGHRLLVRNNRLDRIEATAALPGTSVEVRNLFGNLPARRRFLKHPTAEAQAIRAEVMDKALAHPSVRFTLHATTGAPLVVPEASLVERAAAVFGDKVPAQTLHQLQAEDAGFRITIVAAEPAVVRRDRRLIVPIVNRRRIDEYRIVQAVEYAYRDVLHGGLFPVALVLIDVDPELIDFNIHPAKREARIRPLGQIHHRIVSTLQGFLHAYRVRDAVRERVLWEDEPERQPASYSPRAVFNTVRDTANAPTAVPKPQRPASYQNWPQYAPVAQRANEPEARFHDLRFLGRVYGVFILVENRGELLAIDQHAAHERILYDRFRLSRGAQPLLVPEVFQVSEDQEAQIANHVEEYRALGIGLEQSAPGTWQLTAVPSAYRDSIAELVETIIELRGLNQEFDREFVAQMACKAALKAGDYLDDASALHLARQTLALEDPRCPHGRPLWITLSREELFRRIGRTPSTLRD